MPRRTNIHKYPILKWSAVAARKRSYLWCFRVRSAVPALYAGCILGLLPIYGIQLPLAVLLSFILKANLPILTSLQFITNPITVVPAYFTAYQVGKAVLNVFAVESPDIDMVQMKILMEALQAGNWAMNFKYIGIIWLVTSLGSCILGTFLATIGSLFYKLAAHEVSVSYARLKELQEKRHARLKETPARTHGLTHSKESNHG